MGKEKFPRMEFFFHYLVESSHGTSNVEWLNDKAVRVRVCGRSSEGVLKEWAYDLNIDERDNRVLVVVDGQLLPECFSHRGKLVHQELVCQLETNINHVRTPEGYYRGVTPPFVPHVQRDFPCVANVQVYRHFLLLPVKTKAVFVRPRDLRSLGPMYTLIEVDVENNKPVVHWRNTSW